MIRQLLQNWIMRVQERASKTSARGTDAHDGGGSYRRPQLTQAANYSRSFSYKIDQHFFLTNAECDSVFSLICFHPYLNILILKLFSDIMTGTDINSKYRSFQESFKISTILLHLINRRTAHTQRALIQ